LRDEILTPMRSKFPSGKINRPVLDIEEQRIFI
jgi:hypothetical protein